MRYPNRILGLGALVTVVLGCSSKSTVDDTAAVPHNPVAFYEDISKERTETTGINPARLPFNINAIAPAHTPDDPESAQKWFLSLHDAIHIALDNAEAIRVLPSAIGGLAAGGGPEPVEPVATDVTIYDPAVSETRIQAALAVFDTLLEVNLFWTGTEQPVSSAFQAGTTAGGTGIPIVTKSKTFGLPNATVLGSQDNETPVPAINSAFGAPTIGLSKFLPTGGRIGIAQNISWDYTNNLSTAFRSVYQTNLDLAFSQPLLRGAGVAFNHYPIVIARLNADQAVWNFRQQVINLVRSIEEEYWNLAYRQIDYWANEQAVRLNQLIVEQARAKLETGTENIEALAQAQENLAAARLSRLNALAGLISTERSLRNLLGLPPADGRRIVPSDELSTGRVKPDWRTTLTEAVAHRPDLALANLMVRVTEIQVLQAKNGLLPALNVEAHYSLVGFGRGLDEALDNQFGRNIQVNTLDETTAARRQMRPARTFERDSFYNYGVGLAARVPLGFRREQADLRQAQLNLLRQRAFFNNTLHLAFHGLARDLDSVDTYYKEYRAAEDVVTATDARLRAEAAFYREGRTTADLYLRAVSEWATAISTVSLNLAQYNRLLAILEADKGTLLEYDNIGLAEGPWSAKAYRQAKNQRKAHHALPGSCPPPRPHPPGSAVPEQAPPGPEAMFRVPDLKAAYEGKTAQPSRQAQSGPAAPAQPKAEPSGPAGAAGDQAPGPAEEPLPGVGLSPPPAAANKPPGRG